ncbi:hypothetical protein CC78DRAFT_537344 [Lojkania enalia]|uniref:Uncharacterized protein n=1 Tax=Lojkania enalia TaxID=147567 RepID=A0A9P4JZ94_9PLEO|nr:hypothetical protein CC78DRAFT_537344 [Didymosphaeria enalia]
MQTSYITYTHLYPSSRSPLYYLMESREAQHPTSGFISARIRVVKTSPVYVCLPCPPLSPAITTTIEPAQIAERHFLA